MKDKIQEDHYYSAGGTLKSEEDAPCIIFYCLTFSEAETARIPPLVERNAGVRIPPQQQEFHLVNHAGGRTYTGEDLIAQEAYMLAI